MNYKEILMHYNNRISTGDVFLINKNCIMSEEINNNIRLINDMNSGLAIREFEKENNTGNLCFFYVNDDCEYEKLNYNFNKIQIAYSNIPIVKEKKNNEFINFKNIKLNENEIISAHQLIKNKFKDFNIKKIKMNVLVSDYYLVNTEGVQGNGQYKYYVPYLVIEKQNKAFHFSSMSIVSIDDAISKININLNNILSSREVVNKCDYEILISNSALYELIYLLLFFITDNTILSGLSPFYNNQFKAIGGYNLSNKIKITENSRANKLILGNIDFEGEARNEIDLLSKGKIKNIIGKNISNNTSSGSSYRLDANMLPYTKTSKIYLEPTCDEVFYDSSHDFLLIESFQGLYETIDNKTLDFEATVIGKIIKNDVVTKQFERKSKLNLINTINNLYDFDMNHKYMGDGSILIPCAKMNNLFQ